MRGLQHKLVFCNANCCKNQRVFLYVVQHMRLSQCERKYVKCFKTSGKFVAATHYVTLKQINTENNRDGRCATCKVQARGNDNNHNNNDNNNNNNNTQYYVVDIYIYISVSCFCLAAAHLRPHQHQHRLHVPHHHQCLPQHPPALLACRRHHSSHRCSSKWLQPLEVWLLAQPLATLSVTV